MPCRNDYSGGSADELAKTIPNSLGPPPLSVTILDVPYAGAALSSTGSGAASIVVIDEDSFYRFLGKKSGVNTLIIRGEWAATDFLGWGSVAEEGQPSFSLEIRTGLAEPADNSVTVEINGVVSQPLTSGSYTCDLPDEVVKLTYTITLTSSNRSGAFAAVGPLTLRYYNAH
jgi:hypothetical protein